MKIHRRTVDWLTRPPDPPPWGEPLLNGRATRCFAITATIGVGVGVGVPASASAPAPASDIRAAKLAAPMPSRGLVFTGLAVGGKGSTCAGAFEVRSRAGGALGCTHGPDP